MEEQIRPSIDKSKRKLAQLIPQEAKCRSDKKQNGLFWTAIVISKGQACHIAETASGSR
jgi:hypothetical protein